MKPKTTAAAVLAVLLSVCMLGGCQARMEDQNQSSCCQMVRDALAASRRLRPGMTRRDVERQFYVDGGAQGPESTRYDFAKCGYTKVQIDFKLAGASEHGMPGYNPDDTVTKVSPPYIAAPTLD